ncbi:hypothetical protein DFJ77DRAFT_511947 [Powellomyces hirtus]|nr:hypothetical protein DFJ77DRAFT_511947 [Powellomyces hirtus]
MAEINEPQIFYRIGAGSFAAAYVYVPRGNFVIKRCSHRDRKQELSDEFKSIMHIFKSVHPSHKPAELLASLDIKHCRTSRFDDAQDDLPMYIMRRVWPVAPELHKIISSQQFPEQYRDHDCEFIARVYLGRKKTKASMFFNPNNWPLSTDQLKEVGFDTQRLARSMGSVLGKIVFRSGMDARDIEWVVGASEGDTYRGTGLFVIDFNQCKPHNGDARKVIAAMKTNDPYYPRPGTEEFATFAEGFVLEANDADLEFADHVIQGGMSEARWKGMKTQAASVEDSAIMALFGIKHAAVLGLDALTVVGGWTADQLPDTSARDGVEHGANTGTLNSLGPAELWSGRESQQPFRI